MTVQFSPWYLTTLQNIIYLAISVPTKNVKAVFPQRVLTFVTPQNRRRRLIVQRLDRVTDLVQRPEIVPEQLLGVVFLLERDETVPVLPERRLDTLGGLVTSEQLQAIARQLLS